MDNKKTISQEERYEKSFIKICSSIDYRQIRNESIKNELHDFTQKLVKYARKHPYSIDYKEIHDIDIFLIRFLKLYKKAIEKGNIKASYAAKYVISKAIKEYRNVYWKYEEERNEEERTEALYRESFIRTKNTNDEMDYEIRNTFRKQDELREYEKKQVFMCQQVKKFYDLGKKLIYIAERIDELMRSIEAEKLIYSEKSERLDCETLNFFAKILVSDERIEQLERMKSGEKISMEVIKQDVAVWGNTFEDYVSLLHIKQKWEHVRSKLEYLCMELEICGREYETTKTLIGIELFQINAYQAFKDLFCRNLKCAHGIMGSGKETTDSLMTADLKNIYDSLFPEEDF